MTAVSKLKPEVAEVHAVLRENNALLVHFSYIAKGEKLAQVVDGKEPDEWKTLIDANMHLFYPKDLELCFSNTDWRLSCSTIKPTDTQRNAVGSVGVVLDLTSKESLKLVRQADEGTPRSLEQNVDEDITVDECTKTIRCRPSDNYNEWLVRGFRPIGIFFFSAQTFSVFGPHESGEVEWPIAKVLHDFKGYRSFTADASGFYEIKNGRPELISLEELYP